MHQAALALALAFLSISIQPSFAADQVTLPKGTAIEIQLQDGLQSSAVREGDRFRASVLRPVTIDDVTVIPVGSTVEGRVTLVRSAADGAASGVIGVKFIRLQRPADRPYAIDGLLTSLKVDERMPMAEGVKVSTGRKTPVLLIGSDPDAPIGQPASTLVGGKWQSAKRLADQWASSGLSPQEAAIAPGAELRMELDGPVTLALAEER